MIQGLIFDMDGLLLDTEQYYFRYWIQSAIESGYPMKPRHALAIRSLSAPYAERYLKRELGCDFDYHAVRARRRALIQEAMERDGIVCKAGARALLEYCQKAGILTAVATATAREHAIEHLEQVGIRTLFSVIVGGDSIAHGKPAPDIYQKAADLLSLAPKDCLALEDSPNGILSAFAAGCQPVMVPDLTEPEECIKPLLYAQVASLEDVIGLIEKERSACNGNTSVPVF
jgi:HAD superfamily hydrolase (TIGR01509 family)